MANFLAPIINDQQEDANGNPLNGGSIEVYLAGSSTPVTTYSTQAGVANAWPIVLNTLGLNSAGAVWLTGGASYKFVIKNSSGVTQRTIDNVSGINDTAVTTDQWLVYSGTPVYVSGTSFTLAGDQTLVFQVGRRVKTTNTGGTIYSTVNTSAYSSPNTTVSLFNDSGTLDAGLSAVSYGVISSLNTSLPVIGPAFSSSRITSGQSLSDATFTEIVFNGEDYDSDSAYDVATGRFTPQLSGIYHVSASVTVTVVGGVTINHQILVYKNGTLYKRGATLAFSASSPATAQFTISCDVQLNGSTDYVSVFVFSDLSAGTQSALSSSGASWFDGHFVRRLS
jgi:hypothetical protein